jgi:putative GTP pyrophosphokinase
MSDLSKPFSNNQIDKLGERLKMPGLPCEADLAMLSSYRSSFYEAAKAVSDMVVDLTGLEVTARALKTTMSITAKLRRDGIKQLSSMQDIGGCRVTVSDTAVQDLLADMLLEAFPASKLYDRTLKSSHGYRAKHIVVKHLGKRIEIQIRTNVQHAWALMSETASDRLGQNIKYGVGHEDVLRELNTLSLVYAELEETGIVLGLPFLQEDFDEFEKLIQKKLEIKNDLLH